MDLYIARDMAVSLMREHGLQGWKMQFDNAKRRFGYCNSGKKVISLSHHLVSLNGEEKVKDTILHEIAHAITSNKYGFRVRAHGWEWRREAVAIGCDGHRCYDETVAKPKSKYVAVCPKCKQEYEANKMGRQMRSGQSCGDCCRRYNGSKFSQEFLLIWKKR